MDGKTLASIMSADTLAVVETLQRLDEQSIVLARTYMTALADIQTLNDLNEQKQKNPS